MGLAVRHVEDDTVGFARSEIQTKVEVLPELASGSVEFQAAARLRPEALAALFQVFFRWFYW